MMSMNNLNLNKFIVIILMFTTFPSFGADRSGDKGVVHNLNKIVGKVDIAGVSFPVIIEDGEYKDDLIKKFFIDLQMLMDTIEAYRKIESIGGKSYRISGSTVKSIGLLDFSVNHNRSLPDSVSSQFAYLVNIDGKEYLVLSRNLLNQYKSAIETISSNPAAWDQLQLFVQKIKVLAQTIDPGLDALLDMIVYPEDKVWLKRSRESYQNQSIDKRNILKHKIPIRRVSFLDCAIVDETNSHWNGFIYCNLWYKSEANIVRRIPAVYVKNKWKLLLFY